MKIDLSGKNAVVTAVANTCKASGRDDAGGVVADIGTAEGCDTLTAARPDADIFVNNVGIYGARELSTSTTRCRTSSGRLT